MLMGPHISPGIQLQNKVQAENQTYSQQEIKVDGKRVSHWETRTCLSEINNDSQITDAMGSLQIAHFLLY